ncbi:coiled-coil domain-containing protein [Methylobacterium sp. EM32]|uniref:coiled-coil domain-containing protein n=1 Tax=Methylobacterium sp. EM32 TaxID=3163481 RepID=UPI0033AAE13F
MTAIAFDTLKFARTLRDRAKMPPEQAEGLADALVEAIQGDIPTKADLKSVEASIDALKVGTKSDIEGVKASVEALRANTRADFDTVKASVEALRANTRADFDTVKASIDALRVSAKADVDAVRASSRESEMRLEARIEAAKTETIKWVVGLIGFQILAVIGSVIALARILKP